MRKEGEDKREERREERRVEEHDVVRKKQK